MNIFNIMLSSNRGGLEQMSLVYTRAMLTLGHRVTCLIMPDCPYLKDLQSTNAEIFFAPGRNIYNPLNAYRIIQNIIRTNADIVVCHGNRAMSFVLNRIVRFFIRADFKTIGVMHSRHCPYKTQCDALIFLTQNLYQKQSTAIRKKSFVLANTVMEQPHKPVSLHTPVVFGAMGRMHPIKGFDILLQALFILKQKRKDFYFVLAGSGPEEKKILKQIDVLGLKTHVQNLGWINNKKEFFDKIDVFVLSSRYDSMPLSVLEALAFSKPVIATECVGPKEILSQLQTPLLVPVQNPQKLALAMEYLLCNKEKIPSMSVEANTLFTHSYSFSVFCNKLCQILQKVKYENI